MRYYRCRLTTTRCW